MRTLRRPLLAAVPLFLLACSTTPSATPAVTVADAGECSVAESIRQQTDAGADSWHVGRHYLQCKAAGGSTADCLTSEAACADSTGSVGITDCVDICKTTEYGLSTGSIAQRLPDGGASQSSPAAAPPSSCRDVLDTPAGVRFWCCTCE